MPTSCCVIGCSARFSRDGQHSWYRIPVDPQRRKLWLSAIRREHWEPKAHDRVCGRHFTNGMKSDDPDDPDYSPHISMGYAISGTTPEQKKDRYERQKRRRLLKDEHENEIQAVEALLNLSLGNSKSRQSSDSVPYLESVQRLQKQKEQLETEITFLREEIAKLKSITIKQFGVECIQNNDSKTSFFTGLPTFALFEWLKGYCQCDLPKSDLISQDDILLLILMKLRLNLVNQDIAIRFNISEGLVSSVLNKGLPCLANKLKFLIHWPEREDIMRNLPNVFRNTYKYCRVIIDCTEIFIERPGNLTARAITWSNYKHSNTIKFLVAISPNGAIIFLSKAFGGRASDKIITRKSGFLDLIERGDTVLADRGFLIEDELASRGATLCIPAFTRGKSQLSQRDVETTRKLARVRIHVERAIGRLKMFKIMNSVMPISMVPHADSVSVICAAICNLHLKLVK